MGKLTYFLSFEAVPPQIYFKQVSKYFVIALFFYSIINYSTITEIYIIAFKFIEIAFLIIFTQHIDRQFYD